MTSAREHIYDMKSLEEYSFRDDNGKDQGINGLFKKLLSGSLVYGLIILEMVQYCCDVINCLCV